MAVLALEAAAARQELAASTAQHRQALEEERARRAALWSELATAQREIEVKAAQLRQASEETEQLKQATESATAELRQSLQQERDRAEAMARDLEAARRTVGARVTSEPAASSPISKAAQTGGEVVASGQPTAAPKAGSGGRRGWSRAPAHYLAREISALHGRCSSARSKWAARRQASCSQRHTIPAFCRHGERRERGARWQRPASFMRRHMPAAFRRQRTD